MSLDTDFENNEDEYNFPSLSEEIIYPRQNYFPNYKDLHIADNPVSPIRGVILIAGKKPDYVQLRPRFVPYREKPKPENNDGPVQFGSYVEFEANGDILSGIVIGFTEDGFRISVKGKIYLVDFDDESIEEAEKPVLGAQKIIYPDVPSRRELLVGSVTDDIRSFTITKMFGIFSNIISNVYEGPVYEEDTEDLTNDEKDILNFGMKPWITKNTRVVWKKGENSGWSVEWTFDDDQNSLFFPSSIETKDKVKKVASSYAKNTYVRENLMNWIFSRRYKSLVKKMPDMTDLSQKIALAHLSENTILSDMEKAFDMDISNMKGTELKQKLSDSDSMSVIDVEIKDSLERMSSEDLEKLQGINLLTAVLEIIRNFISQFPPNSEQIRSQLERAWVRNQFFSMKPTKKEKKLFDETELEKLRGIYSERLNLYKSMKEKIEHAAEQRRKFSERKQKAWEHSEEMKRKISQVRVVRINGTLSNKGFQLILDIEKFERDCLISAGGENANIAGYLTQIFKSISFLQGDLKNYAKFLHAKISSGDISIASLHAATLPYLFPELAMNFSALSDEKWEESLYGLSSAIKVDILEMIDAISRQRTGRSQPQIYQTTFDWSKYLTSVTEKCQNDSKSGKRPSRNDQGEVQYQKVNVGSNQNPDWEMHPILEDLPLGDIVICYEADNDIFSCHSIDEVLRDIKMSPEKAINSFTNEPYPETFVEKMKERYPERLRSLSMEIQSPPKSPWKLSPSEIKEVIQKISPKIMTKEKISKMNQLENRLKEDVKTVLYFYSTWNNKSKDFEDEWNEIERDYTGQFDFIRIDTDISKEINKEYKIKKFPAVVVVQKTLDGQIENLGKKVGGKLIQEFLEELVE